MGTSFSRQSHSPKIQDKNMKQNLIIETSEVNNTEEKKLAVILPWMSAKDRYLDKYKSLYLSRGFDVVTFNFLPKHFLFPTYGSHVVVTNLLEYLETHQNYSKIVIHAFSVGAYLMGEIFIKMLNNTNNYTSVAERIEGVILDSAVDYDNVNFSLPRAISRNTSVIKCLEWYFSIHLFLMYEVSTKYYIQSSKHFHDTLLQCPALVYVSEIDRIGTVSGIKKVMDRWESKGVDVKWMIFKDSEHVGHFRKYPDEYVSELDKFLQKINLIPSSSN